MKRNRRRRVLLEESLEMLAVLSVPLRVVGPVLNLQLIVNGDKWTTVCSMILTALPGDGGEAEYGGRAAGRNVHVGQEMEKILLT